MYVLNAKSSYDVEDSQPVVEITTDRWLPGTGWKKHTDFVYTRSNGDWSELNFNRTECVKYVNFLNTMVERNLDVCRKIAFIQTEMILERHNWSSYLRLMNSLTLLDPTFEPPMINLKCRWQRELLESICNEWTKTVVLTCNNCVRLTNFSKKIESFLA